MRSQKLGSKTPPFNEIPPWRQRLPRAVQMRDYDAMVRRCRRLARDATRLLPIGFDASTDTIPDEVVALKKQYDELSHEAKVYAQLNPWVR